jgi:hypothetical protein
MPMLSYVKRICDKQVEESGIIGLRLGVNSKRRFRSYEIFIHFNGKVSKMLIPWKDAELVKKELLGEKISQIIKEVISDHFSILPDDV